MALRNARARKQYDALLEADPHCHYCREPVSRTPAGGRERRATADHIVPRAYGGNDNPANIVLACWACNQAKMHQPVTCWCDRCCEAVAFYATKWLDANAAGFRIGPRPGFAEEMARQGRAVHV